MTWNTNWQGDINKVLDASNVLNTDHLFDEDGESYTTQNSGINKTDNSVLITYLYTSVGESIGTIKSIKGKTLAFISKSSNDDSALLKMKQENYKELSQSKDPFKELLKYGHFYELKSFVNFYKNYARKFPIKTIRGRKIESIVEMKLNGKLINANQMFAECATHLLMKDGVWLASNMKPETSEDLITSVAPSKQKIHTHPNISGELLVSYKGGETLKYIIKGEEGPSSSLDPNEPGDMQLSKNNSDGIFDIVIDKKSVWLYNQFCKIDIGKTYVI